MCGIFGIFKTRDVSSSASQFRTAVNKLFELSESRGKEAAGLAMLNDTSIQIYKQPISASQMIKQKHYTNLFNELENGNTEKLPTFSAIGHSRLVTNGTEDEHDNNQPVYANGVAGVHNGIIVNDTQLWDKYSDMVRKYEVDTEVIFSLIGYLYQNLGLSPVEAVRRLFNEIEGAASIATFFDNLNNIILATNNGSLYFVKDQENSQIVFGSEYFILDQFYENHEEDKPKIIHVHPGEAYLIDLCNLDYRRFDLEGEVIPDISFSKYDNKRVPEDVIASLGLKDKYRKPVLRRPNPGARDYVQIRVPKEYIKHFDECQAAISKLRRCTKCVLPETMPFIEFDQNGVCNYCRDFKGLGLKGHDELIKLLKPLKKADNEASVLLGLSGGRDSTYALHYLVNEVGIKPITYTFDWGMITDLARRNISRICGKLGVENILVSADINEKRANIRRNVLAWLKQPDLGIIPLFMAGDKQYFYFAEQVRKQNNLHMIIFGDNLFERTNFKAGFCGVAPKTYTKEKINVLTLSNKLKMLSYYFTRYLKNPAYINRSLIDSFYAFASYYVLKKDYVNIYNYIPWIEKEVSETIIKEYDWEVAGDTENTWRIGDGTASFYNYIYYLMAGLSENDTFRSNQIRAGQISREFALERISEDNKPRYESIKWYCDTIGIDFDEAVGRINAAPKRYKL